MPPAASFSASTPSSWPRRASPTRPAARSTGVSTSSSPRPAPPAPRAPRTLVKAALEALNYAPSNLAGFPQAAFDRPIGTKLEKFGRTIAPDNIEARAEGSGCPVGGLGAGGLRAAHERQLLDLVPQARLDGRGHGLGRPVPCLHQLRRPEGRPDPVDHRAAARRRAGRLGLELPRRQGRLLRPLSQVRLLVRGERGPAGRAGRRPVLADRSPATTRRRAIPSPSTNGSPTIRRSSRPRSRSS